MKCLIVAVALSCCGVSVCSADEASAQAFARLLAEAPPSSLAELWSLAAGRDLRLEAAELERLAKDLPGPLRTICERTERVVSREDAVRWRLRAPLQLGRLRLAGELSFRAEGPALVGIRGLEGLVEVEPARVAGAREPGVAGQLPRALLAGRVEASPPGRGRTPGALDRGRL